MPVLLNKCSFRIHVGGNVKSLGASERPASVRNPQGLGFNIPQLSPEQPGLFGIEIILKHSETL